MSNKLFGHVHSQHPRTQFIRHQVNGATCRSSLTKKEAISIHLKRTFKFRGTGNIKQKVIIAETQSVRTSQQDSFVNVQKLYIFHKQI